MRPSISKPLGSQNFSPARKTIGWGWGMVIAIALATGCQATGRPDSAAAPRDGRLSRLAEDGQQAYAEGQTDTAIKHYRKAIRRAWAMDDAAEAGTLTYNLAACLISSGRLEEARQWLVESRAELVRGRQSVGNAWLLEAKIARNQGRIDDAQHYIALARCASPPCDHLQPEPPPCGDEDCERTIAESLPCVGKKIQQQDQQQDCGQIFSAQVQLAKARLVNDLGDTQSACQHLACARQLATGACARQLRGELESVAGMIHLSRGEPLRAARHFDREAAWLRQAGTFREVPYALQMAAESYASAGRIDLSIDRWCRAARILHGRGDQAAAWQCVKAATRLVNGIIIRPIDPLPAGDFSFRDDDQITYTREKVATVELLPWESVVIPGTCQPSHDDWIEQRLRLIAREIHLALEAAHPEPEPLPDLEP